MKKIKSEFKEFLLLMRVVPGWITAFFVLAVFSMNLLANKSIELHVSWLALDCGIIVSWFAFLTLDIVTKHFGPKAATQISLFSVAVNLTFCLLFYIVSVIDGDWGQALFGDYPDAANKALNGTFGGTWFIVLGSTVAFVISSLINNFTNWGIGTACKKNPDGFGAYILRTYVSTAVGQFADNLIFAMTVSHFFFGWTLVQCITCALTGMIAEFLSEAIFSPLGYVVCQRWKRDNIGKEYFELIKENSNESINYGNRRRNRTSNSAEISGERTRGNRHRHRA